MNIKDFKIERIATQTYSIGDGWMVDIVESRACREAWLYHEGYCIKEMMFGEAYGQNPYNEFLKTIACCADE